MACMATRLMSSGAAKSGKPCDRFTAPCLRASRVISRITDSVNRLAFLETWRCFEAAGVVIQYSSLSWRCSSLSRRGAELLRRNSQNFLHLRIPICPCVTAWELAIFMRNLSGHQDINEVAVALQQWIFSAAININERQRRDACSRE